LIVLAGLAILAGVLALAVFLLYRFTAGP